MKARHHRLLLAVLVATLVLVSCYDDDNVWDALANQQQRIEALEAWQKTTASNIEALRVLSSEKELITAVTPVMQSGVTVGYTIAFTTHDPVTIFHGITGPQGSQGATGPQGETGATPDIGIKRGEDGNWYWTLNGTIMTGTGGIPLRANPTDGQPVPPQVQTGQQLIGRGVSSAQCIPPTGAWTPDAIYLSTDGGTSWTQVSGNPGTNGRPIFKSVDYETDPLCVTFTLADGTTFSVLQYTPIALSFTYNPTNDENAEKILVDPTEAFLLFPTDGGDYKMYYTLKTDGIKEENIRVSAYVDGTEWKATFGHEDGTIQIYLPNNPGSRDVLHITATDNKGHSCTYQFILKRYFDGHDGSNAANAYVISCAQELEMVAKEVNENNNDYSSKFFRMDNEIDLKGKEWTPIGGINNQGTTVYFKGNFDGDGHCIRGLKVVNGDKKFAGLFGFVDGGIIENITLIDPEVETTLTDCGALAGYCTGATLRNCYVQGGSCTAGNNVGGLIGSANNTSISNCYVQGGSCTAGSYAGGLAGHAKDTPISNCHVKGTAVTATDASEPYSNAGGLAGYIDANNPEVTDCSASDCTVTAATKGCGGLFGVVSNATQINLTACYTTGTISSNGEAGGLIGWIGINEGGSINITGCYSGCTITDKQEKGGILIGSATYGGSDNPAQPTYTHNYYLTDQEDTAPVTGIGWRPKIDKDIIKDMNNGIRDAIGGTQDYYALDGHLLSENWKE